MNWLEHDLILVNPSGKVEVMAKGCHPDLLDSLQPYLVRRPDCLWVSCENGRYAEGDLWQVSDILD